ncbi:MAG TPA: DUF3291 domain-containing protein [Terracidiphilus sp.]|jgi:hypothetical protein
MAFVSVTRLRVRSWLYLPAFFFETMRIARQAKKAQGNLGVKVLGDRRNTYWTLTSWASEASIKAFMLAPPHGPVMRKLLEWCDEASLARWTQEGAELPAWDEAHQRLLHEGRPSKVNHPSTVHTQHAIPAPVVGPGKEVRFK